MAKPAPKNNLTQTLLFAAMMVMVFTLFNNSKNTQQQDTRDLKALRAAVVKDDTQRLDSTIQTDKSTYERKLQSELDAKRLTKADFDGYTVEAETLADHVIFRLAKLRQVQHDPAGAFNFAQAAYNQLKGLEKQYSTSPLWTTVVEVRGGSDDPRTQLTPKELLADEVKLASELGASTPCWGFFPGYQVVDALVKLTGSRPAFSYAFAALLMAICVRGIIWKLAQKQLMWSRQMSQLTPLTNELKEKYTGQELQTKIMELYKEYGMNPMQGCLPMFIQMPLFLLIYNAMLHYRFEFQKGTFLWIGSGLADRFHFIVARNLGERDYPLIVLYGISMITTTLLTPVQDPSNAKQQRMMGLSMSVMFAIMMFFWPIPSAFVLYWIFTNILATSQSLRAYKLPLPPLVKVNAPGGGVYPTNGKPTAERYKSTGTPKVHKPKRAKKK